MSARVATPSLATRAGALLAVLASVAGCGSSVKTASAAHAGDPIVGVSAPQSCPATVISSLRPVLRRIYREGVASERTLVAEREITGSAALREALKAGDPRGAQAAAQALVAAGHITDLRVISATGQTLAAVGAGAVAPLRGTLRDSHRRPIGSYITSVWSDSGFLAEGSGVTEGKVALVANGRMIAGSSGAPVPGPGSEGTLTAGTVQYQYSSFAGKRFPAGHLRVYLFRTLQSTAALCGSTSEETLVNTLTRVARLIYDGEVGGRTLPQISRVQANAPLLLALARHDAKAVRRAIDALLNQHIVRLRVSDASGHVLADVGGPYVLAPVSAPLRLGGRQIGSLVLSIQDDEGYLRLARRLAGLDVLMFMGQRLVKNSLGPSPGAVPESGPYEYRGRYFRVYTVHASAFPSGPLTIRVLIPIPYA